MYRQGDILLVPTDQVPDGATPVQLDGGRVILAYGEATGHHHSFAPGGVDLLEVDGDRYLDVRSMSDLVHQEHAAIAVPPGTYRVVRQREYDDAEEWRAVAD